jgi:hypothetical protein
MRVAQLETNAAGNGRADAVFTPEGIGGIVEFGHGHDSAHAR